MYLSPSSFQTYMRTLLFSFSILFLIACSFTSFHDEQSTIKESKPYSAIVAEIEIMQDSLQKLYSTADSIQKESITKSATEFLINKATQEVFPAWYGTKWDYEGITQKPQEGRIACGYFVMNVLIDLGFDIPRYKWAQSPSEPVIKKLAGADIKRFFNKPVHDVGNYLKQSGTGLYVVGLDSHIGFIKVENDSIRFVHSNFYCPEIGVMSEALDTENPLNDSRYRIVGKLFTQEMVENWLTAHKYE